MKQFFEDQRALMIFGAFLLAIAGWGSEFKTWAELFTVGHIFGLMLVLGGLLTAWGTKRPDFIKPDPQK
jgi:hypothetical protein